MAKTIEYEQVIKKLKIPYRSAPQSEMIMDCPDKGCPNPKDHLYMNKKTSEFICHRCGLSGNMITFLIIVKRISFNQAKTILSDGEPEGTDLTALKLRVAEVQRVETALYSLEKDGVLRNIILPPKGSKLVTRSKFPSYLKERETSLRIATLLGVRYCNSGRYASRLIFPFACAEHESFVAYATRESDRKTLNPPGSYNRDLLFGYDLMHKIKGKYKFPHDRPTYKGLIVVEGIFDFIRMFSYGYWCVALLKSYLSKSQAILLNNSRFKTITFLLDGDITDDEYEKKLRSLTYIDSKRVKIARIPDENTDPDELSSKQTTILLHEATEKHSNISSLRKKAERLKKQH